jgi:hypothetical protein
MEVGFRSQRTDQQPQQLAEAVVSEIVEARLFASRRAQGVRVEIRNLDAAALENVRECVGHFNGRTLHGRVVADRTLLGGTEHSSVLAG